MKRTSFYSSIVFFGIVALFATSCAKLKPLSQSNFTVTPSPLETVGKNVPGTVSATFPEKWFNKNAIVTITPVLKFDGNREVTATPYSYQGENISGNRTPVSYTTGGNVTLNFNILYRPEMQSSELYVRFDGKIKNKKAQLPDIKVADGIIATSTLASVRTTAPSIADDGFQRVIKQAQDANIHFVIQQANLRSTELNKEDMTTWKQRVQQAFNDPKQNVNVEVSAYASPDGGVSLNEKLAAEREKNTSEYLEKELKKRNINTDINARYTAQDWEGFRKLVETSNLQDKELILRVLEMYPDSETREREIKNISIVYDDLASTILPQLRRSRITANIDIIGKSDEEILSFWKNTPNNLTVEELLYASTLTSDKKEKERIYQFVTNRFPQDYRGWNNLGALFFTEGSMDKAKQAFDRAAQVKPDAPEVNMNKALLAMMNNDTETAKELLGKAPNANALEGAMGVFYLMEGEYNQAVRAFGDTKSNNAALAHLLTKDYNTALNTLENVSNADATTSYLAAIIASRTNNFNDVVMNLRSAIALDRFMANKALHDLEFAKYRNNPEFMSLLK